MTDPSASTMHYRGYTARIEYDDHDRIFTGRLIGVQDIVVFHGSSVDELNTAFRQSVDDYLAACQTLGLSSPESGVWPIDAPAAARTA